MVVCGCGKAIDKLPVWLAGVNVEFVCNNCPNRQLKPINQLHVEQQAALKTEAENLAAAQALESQAATDEVHEPEMEAVAGVPKPS